MGLLNLHTHSNNSDGTCSIAELAEAYQKAGHIALCITDHDYFMTSDKWERTIDEAAHISFQMNFPIIVGLEAFVEGVEEVLVFGQDVCRSLLTCNALTNVVLFKEWYARQTSPFAMIVAHPYLWTIHDDFYLMMDGYEVTNSGKYWGDDYVERMEKLMPAPRRAYHGQDTHELRDLSHRCNEVPENLIINTEIDLIKYLSVCR